MLGVCSCGAAVEGVRFELVEGRGVTTPAVYARLSLGMLGLRAFWMVLVRPFFQEEEELVGEVVTASRVSSVLVSRRSSISWMGVEVDVEGCLSELRKEWEAAWKVFLREFRREEIRGGRERFVMETLG